MRKPWLRKNLVDDKKRKIREMLVIDRVELPLLDQMQQMRKFERGGSSRFQQQLEAGDEIMQVGHVGEHVVRGHQIGGLAGRRQAARGLGAEKRHLGRDALVPRHLGDVGRRLDAENADAALFEVLQQIAVIAGDFDDERAAVEREAL